jgi:MinD-like ATPase involved in chromosome partitioning or flagellar assembly
VTGRYDEQAEQVTAQYGKDGLAGAAPADPAAPAAPAPGTPGAGLPGVPGPVAPQPDPAAAGTGEHAPPNYDPPPGYDQTPAPAEGPPLYADPHGSVPEGATQHIPFPAAQQQHTQHIQPGSGGFTPPGPAAAGQPGQPGQPGSGGFQQPFPAPQQYVVDPNAATAQYPLDPAAQQQYFAEQPPPQQYGVEQPPQQYGYDQQQFPPQAGFPALPGQPGLPGQALVRQGGPGELSSAQLLKQTKRPPQSGWRRTVYQASGHVINLGESPADVRRRELIARINQPLRGCYKIAMLSLKGGVGKTTTTTTLGSTFSSLRGDRVIAVDANPDRGTLSQKIPLETTATVRHLLRDAARITRYSDVRAYTSQGPSRLEVLASEQDPAVSEAFSEDDYRRSIDLLEHFYNIVLTDCGTGLMHSAMKGVLDIADSLVIVSSGSVDGARSASATLDWLDAHGYHDLVARSVAVINSVRPRSGAVDLDKLAEHFGARCRAVCRIPFDPHLEEGAEIELDRLAGATRLALLELGATVADDFPNDVNRR